MGHSISLTIVNTVFLKCTILPFSIRQYVFSIGFV